MSNRARKHAHKKILGTTHSHRGGCLLLVILGILSAFIGRHLWQDWGRRSEDVVKIIARNKAAADECVSFLSVAGSPEFQNPDELQIKRPHKMFFVGGEETRGDVVSLTTSPITYFIIKKEKMEFKAGKPVEKPYYLVDVVRWPDMVYLAHKEIYAENPTYTKRSKRSRTGYVTVRGEDTTLYKWIGERMQNDPYPLPWEKGW